MSDQSNMPTGVSANPTSIAIGMGAQYIKDFSFEAPHAPQIFASLQTAPQLSIDVNVTSRGLGDNTFESALTVKIDSKLAGKTAFIAELTYAGLFSLPQLPEEQAKLFLLVEAPRLLFPFARAMIANTVREGGFPNIMIQPIDFMALYNAQRGQVGSMHPAGAA